VELAKRKQVEDELADCSFKPRINALPSSAVSSPPLPLTVLVPWASLLIHACLQGGEPLPRDRSRPTKEGENLQRVVDSTRTEESLIQAGVGLYERGTARLWEAQRRAAEARRCREEEEVFGATFAPEINRGSRQQAPRYLDPAYHRHLEHLAVQAGGSRSSRGGGGCGRVVEVGRDGQVVVFLEGEGGEDAILGAECATASLSLLEEGDVRRDASEEAHTIAVAIMEQADRHCQNGELTVRVRAGEGPCSY